jgi:SAM-dependent methyltransferase
VCVLTLPGMERYTLRGGQAGYDRLKILARIRRPSTQAFLERAGLRAGMRCVDLGCGGGEGTFDIAAMIGPSGSVVGIDMDEVTVALGRKSAAERGITTVDFRVGSVNDWDESESYDFVYCRCLLQHLSRPVDVLARMWAAVTPGGVLAVEDTDFGGLFCHPANDGYAFFQQMITRVVAHNGGDSTIGLRLYRFFLDLGARDPGLAVTQNVDAVGESKTMPLLTLQSISESIVAAGLASAAEVEAAIEDLGAFIAAPDTILSGPRVLQVWARKEASS